MSSRRIVASCAGMAGVLVVTGWYTVLAFPLAAPAVPGPEVGAPQGQAQPRDPRPDVARPVTPREQELKAAIDADASKTASWLELARLQEQRGAIAEAEATLRSALTATGQPQVLRDMAAFFVRTGQFDNAVAALEGAAAQTPGDPKGHQIVATYYWEKVQRDSALTPADKLMYIEAGIRATDRALAIQPEYVEALTYKNILLRMKGNMETDAVRRKALYDEADALRGQAMALAKTRPPSPPSASSGQPAPPPPPPPPPPSEYYQVDGQQSVRIGGNVPTPKKLRDVRPVYPQEAMDAGVKGVVIVEAIIDTQGDVRSTRVLRSIPALDDAALEAVRQWRFTPTVLDGVAVPVVMTVTVNFGGQ